MLTEVDASGRVEVGASTHTGRARELNEDSLLVQPPVFAVADGMGGHAAGEVASAIAVHALGGLAPGETVTDDVVTAIRKANGDILAAQAVDPAVRGMGTTLAGVCLGSVAGVAHWFVFNVGDSRVYSFADGRLSQVTDDHSEIAELLAAGLIRPEDVAHHPARSVVTRSLGTEPPPAIDTWIRPFVEGERLLICSDGLNLELTDEQIGQVLAEFRPPQITAETLVERAVEAGGRDNVTVVVVDVAHSKERQPVDVATAPRSRLE